MPNKCPQPWGIQISHPKEVTGQTSTHLLQMLLLLTVSISSRLSAGCNHAGQESGKLTKRWNVYILTGTQTDVPVQTDRQMDWQCRETDRQTFIQFGQHMHDGLGNAHLLNAHIWRVEQEFWYRKPFIVHPNQLHKKNNDTWATSELSASSSPSSNH